MRELIPDGEVWDNLIEFGNVGAIYCSEWFCLVGSEGSFVNIYNILLLCRSMWDHLIQDYDPTKANYGNVRKHPEKFDVNFCPAGGKAACRDQTLLRPENAGKQPAAHSPPGATGEKDWLHINAVSYDRVRDQVIMSLNVPGEIIIVDHSTTMVSGDLISLMCFPHVYPIIIETSPSLKLYMLWNR